MQTPQSGFSLIAALISLALGILILSLVFEAYNTYQQNYHFQAALQRTQYAANRVIDILVHDIHQAGYIGCMKLTKHNIVAGSTAWTNQNKLTIKNHQLTLRYMDKPHVILLQDASQTSRLYVSREVIFSPGEKLILSDCVHAEFIQLRQRFLTKHEQILILANNLRYAYSAFAEIGVAKSITYFTAKTKRKHRDGKPIYALFSQSKNQNRIELQEGVKRLNFLLTSQKNQPFLEQVSEDIDDSTIKGIDIDIELEFSPLIKHWHAYATLS